MQTNILRVVHEFVGIVLNVVYCELILHSGRIKNRYWVSNKKFRCNENKPLRKISKINRKATMNFEAAMHVSLEDGRATKISG